MFGITAPTGSHVPTLDRVVRELPSNALIIEHGAGLYSTVLFSWMDRRVLCVESDPGWREWAQWVLGCDGEIVESIPWARLKDASLVFIDGAAKERAPLLAACLAAQVPLIVAHDTHERCWTEYGWTADMFAAPGYTVTHDDFKRKYRTTLWQR